MPATLTLVDPKTLKPTHKIDFDPRDYLDHLLMQDIRDHGIVTPLKCLGNDVLDGHRRLAAALLLGMESVPIEEIRR